MFLDILEFFCCVPKAKQKPEYEIVDGGIDDDFEVEFIDEENITEVKLKENTFDVNRIIEYKGESLKKLEFRPKSFGQFIGQTEAKEKAGIIIEGIRKGIYLHFLIDGIKGHGKTTMVELIAKQLNAKLIERVGKLVNENNLVDIINEINTSKEKIVILFIDEIESMDWKVLKILNPVIESYKIAGKKIKPFIFVGATINKHIIIEKNPDTLDRIHEQIKFKRYNTEEIGKIIELNHKQLFPEINVSEEVIKTISANCKFNPRTSISLLKQYIITENLDKVLKSSGIVKNGLTKNDIKILNVLSKASRPIGAKALALRCGFSQKEYETEFEPFLYEYGYIERVPSRVITEKGRKLLEEIKIKEVVENG